MKIFLDTANLDELKKAVAWGIVDGVTTNPSLIAKEGIAIEEQVARICDIIDGDISAEVVATEAKEMVIEGHKLAKIHKNIVVKLPLTRDGIEPIYAPRPRGHFDGRCVRAVAALCRSLQVDVIHCENINNRE